MGAIFLYIAILSFVAVMFTALMSLLMYFERDDDYIVPRNLSFIAMIPFAIAVLILSVSHPTPNKFDIKPIIVEQTAYYKDGDNLVNLNEKLKMNISPDTYIEVTHFKNWAWDWKEYNVKK